MRYRSIFFTVIFIIVVCFCLVGCQDDNAPEITEYEIEYKDGLTLSSVTPPDGYAWTFPDYELEVGVNLCTLTVGNKRYQVKVTVLPAEFVDIVLEDAEFVYDGEPKSILISGFLPENTVVEYYGNDVTDVGEYLVTAKLSRDGYIDRVLTAQIRIKRAAYDMSGVSFTDKTYVYDGTEKVLTIDGDLPDGVTVEYTANSLTNAGSVTVTATFTGDDDHVELEPMTATLTITEAAAPEMVFDGVTFVYDGSPKSIYISGELPTGISVTYTGNGATDAGTYTVTAIFETDGNYSLPEEMTATLVIEQAEFGNDLTLPEYTCVYDGEKHYLSVNGAPDGSEIVYTGNEAVNAGSYEVTATVSHRNYRSVELRSVITIERARYDTSALSFTSRQFVYDGTPKYIYVTGVPTGVTVNYIGNGMIDCGVYTVVADFIPDANHEDISSLSAQLTVNKAPVENLTFDDGLFVYDGRAKEIYVSGDIPDETRISYSGNGIAAAGVHAVTAHIDVTDNYEPVSDMKARLIIEPAAVGGVTLPDFECVYDGKPHSVTLEGKLPNGSSVTYIGNGAISAGTHIVTAKIKLSPNYRPIPDLTAKITIRKATVGKLYLPDAEFVYDGTAHSLNITGELPDDAEVSYVNNSRVDAGVYEVIARVKLSENYNAVDDIKATLTIKQAVWDGITFPDGEFLYDGSPHSIYISGSLPPDSTVTYIDNERTDAGNYTVTAQIRLSDNYIPLADLTASLIIDKAEVKGIAFAGGTYVYDGTAKSARLTGVPSDIVAATISGTAAADVGEYVWKASFKVDKNYLDIPDMYAKISILRADPSYTCKKTEFIYNGAAHSLDIVRVHGEETEITLSAQNIVSGKDAQIKDIGEYEVTASVPQSANYNAFRFQFTVKVISNDFSYDIVGGKCRITDYTGTGASLVYPATINGTSVESIGQSTENEVVTSIDAGSGARDIKVDRFTALKELKATDNTYLTAIDNVIYDSRLSQIKTVASNYNGSVHIPSSVKAIGTEFAGTPISAIYADTLILAPYAFANCTDLTTVSLTPTDGIVPDGAFNNCFNMTPFSMNGIVKIGKEAFYNVPFEALVLDLFCSVEASSFSADKVTAVSCAYSIYSEIFLIHNVKYLSPYAHTSGHYVALSLDDMYLDMESGDILEHGGTDLIYGSAAAVTAFCGAVVSSVSPNEIALLSDDGMIVKYGDITPLSVSVGQRVAQGEIIGYADNVHVSPCIASSYGEESYAVHISAEYLGKPLSPNVLLGI